MFSDAISLGGGTGPRAHRADAYLQEGEVEAALRDCEIVLESDAGNAAALLTRAQACGALQKFGEAADAFEAFLQHTKGKHSPDEPMQAWATEMASEMRSMEQSAIKDKD
eukprot:TRINITY_DN9950_c0_g1_i1.p1 TRINITY_DN9950_c0_g1~~TRINITY_DN9950_c0_g1_i1.p1  ORF type:complete len:110 (-),score=10.32 TRINITY_DN9950_c0_g1_i1:31-360(-)